MEALAARPKPLSADGTRLEMLSNRGMKLWPDGTDETVTVDETRCRFQLPEVQPGALPHQAMSALLNRIEAAGIEWVKVEGLYNFDGKPGFSRGEGQ